MSPPPSQRPDPAEHRRALRVKDPEVAAALGCVTAALESASVARRSGEAMGIHVGCSGGPDSVALLLLLDLAAHGQGLRLSVGHVDHGLRASSAGEARAVQALAQRLGWPFDCAQLALAQGPGLPARARDARRAALLTQARARDAPVLALGHTATDQLETLLMHLTRGAGLDGLSGMPSFDGVLLRPLLALTRAQSAAICTHFDEPVVHDPTNDATDHFRIELRKQVLPRLRAHNPKVEGAAHASAQLVRDADEAIAAWVQRELELRRTVKGQAKGADVTYALRDYQTLPRAIRFGFVRAVLLEAGVDASELRLRVVADIDRALMGDLAKGRGPAPRRWDLPGGYVGHVARAQLWAQKTDPRPVADL